MLAIRGILLSFNIVSRFSIFLSLASYVYFGNVFTSRQVFIVTSYFNFLYDSMLHFWPIALTTLAECFVTLKRVEAFLLLPEEKVPSPDSVTTKDIAAQAYKTEQINAGFLPDILPNGLSNNEKSLTPYVTDNTKSSLPKTNADIKVIFKNVTALWSKESQLGINRINLELSSNQLCTIIGPVGSGKSTILHTILGELETDSGELIVNGKVSYSCQEPFLFEGSVRQNILFTEKYDEQRYKEVIRVCALERDLQLLPYGDYQMIGERGASLSGGQRARVNLARAIYRKADIYLLDDPLSAVDTLVGQVMFTVYALYS